VRGKGPLYGNFLALMHWSQTKLENLLTVSLPEGLYCLCIGGDDHHHSSFLTHVPAPFVGNTLNKEDFSGLSPCHNIFRF
jgi:hypothetical protein